MPLMWGGTLNGYRFWWFASFLATPLLIGAVGYWFKLHGQPLPGGSWNLLLLLAVLLGGPALAVLKRKRGLEGRMPMEAGTFVTGVRGVAPEVPESFIMAAREALAAAYCVPVELIGHADSRRRIMALSALNQPLALEIIADICRREGMLCNYERMYAAAKPFKTLRPTNVAELVQVLHREMKTAQLVSGGGGPGAS